MEYARANKLKIQEVGSLSIGFRLSLLNSLGVTLRFFFSPVRISGPTETLELAPLDFVGLYLLAGYSGRTPIDWLDAVLDYQSKTQAVAADIFVQLNCPFTSGIWFEFPKMIDKFEAYYTKLTDLYAAGLHYEIAADESEITIQIQSSLDNEFPDVVVECSVGDFREKKFISLKKNKDVEVKVPLIHGLWSVVAHAPNYESKMAFMIKEA